MTGSSSTKAEAQPLTILCFGDSLTEGYSGFGMHMTPYSEALEAELKVKLLAREDRREIGVLAEGESGDLVTTGSFRARMIEAYTTTPSTPLYNYTLFLGGTNDLGWGKPANEIWAAIKSITSIPLSYNSKLVLFTVPECGVKNASLDKRRSELNRLIKEDDRQGVYVFDLHAAIPYHSMPETERDEIWDDGLHFTPMGYERMGGLVAERLMEIIELEESERDDAHSG